MVYATPKELLLSGEQENESTRHTVNGKPINVLQPLDITIFK